MKEIKTEKTVTVTRYIAFDGTEFDNQSACMQYENDDRRASVKELFKLNSISKIEESKSCDSLGFSGFIDDDEFWKVRPTNENELHVINRVLARYNNEVFETDAIGSWIILRRPEGCEEIYGYSANKILCSVVETHRNLFPIVEEDGSEDK